MKCLCRVGTTNQCICSVHKSSTDWRNDHFSKADTQLKADNNWVNKHEVKVLRNPGRSLPTSIKNKFIQWKIQHCNSICSVSLRTIKEVRCAGG